MTYIPGDYWMICHVCGFKIRRSRMKKRYDGAWVCDQCWTPQHPQEFVKSIKETIAVPVARPDDSDIFDETTVKTAGSKGDGTIDLDSVSGLSDTYSLGIVLDDDTVHWTFCDGDPSGNTVTLKEELRNDAAKGNAVYIPGSSFITTAITQDDL